jgi:hypothetical protein
MLPADTPLRRQVFRGLLDILRQVPDGAVSDIFVFESRAEAIELAGDIPGAILFWIGDYRMGREAFRERSRRAIADGRLTEAALASIAQSLAELALGELDTADASAAQAQICDRRAKPQVFTAVTIRMNAMMRARLRDYGVGETLAGLERRARPDYLGSSFPGRKLAACIALYAAVGQRRDAALEALDRAMPAIELAPAWADNYTLAVSHAAEALWTLGERRHLESIERSLREKVLTADFRFPNTDARLSLARLCALTDRYAEASDWFAKARVVLDEQGARPLRAITDFDEAWMYLRRGLRTDRARAAGLLDAAVAQFDSIGMPGWVERAKTLL